MLKSYWNLRVRNMETSKKFVVIRASFFTSLDIPIYLKKFVEYLLYVSTVCYKTNISPELIA